MSNKTIEVNADLHQYILQVSLREPAILRRLREETAAMPEHNMQIAPEQGQFMGLLIRMMGANRCLEIGTFTGYASLAIALALDQDGTLLALDTSEEYTDVARRYWDEAGVADKIELRLAPALETLDEMLDADDQRHTYDFVFIDADKTNYDNYYERCLQLVRTGGVIAFDNTLWDGKVADKSAQDADTAALRELNAKLYADERIELSMLPLADGLTLCRKAHA